VTEIPASQQQGSDGQAVPNGSSGASTAACATIATVEEMTRRWFARFPGRSAAVVAVVAAPFAETIECLRALTAAGDDAVPLVVIDAGDEKRTTTVLVEMAARGELLHVQVPAGGGSIRLLNAVIALAAPRDVAILASDTIVPPGWLDRLASAAQARTTVASATPFTHDGSLVSIPHQNHATAYIPRGMTVEQADARVRDAALRDYPVLPAPNGSCAYYTRAALSTVGAFDEAFAPFDGEHLEWAQRAIVSGFVHVVADDVFVGVNGYQAVQVRQARLTAQLRDERLQARYPWYGAWYAEAARSARSPLSLAIARARNALIGKRVVVDARALRDTTMGTQVVLLELIRALATHPKRPDHLAVMLEDGITHRALGGLELLVDDIVHTSEILDRDEPAYDLIHRPFQVPSLHDLVLLRRTALRCVVTHLDSIAYANPSYAPDPSSWEQLRLAMRLTFAYADGIAFLSHDALDDARHQGLYVPDERGCVTYAGVDHHLLSPVAEAPPALVRRPSRPFLCVVGTDYTHKNRVFAMRILRDLLTQFAWDGDLVFAGTAVTPGGSGGGEALEWLRNPALRARVHYLGAVNESEKRWLYEHAAAVLYPSVYEGFGLIPFEAAAAGTPALAARTTSVAEILGADVEYLDLTDPAISAETVSTMITDAERSRRQVAAINARAPCFTWDTVATTTLSFYEEIMRMPPRTQAADDLEAVARAEQSWAELRRECETVLAESRGVRETAMSTQREYERLQYEYGRLSGWATDLESRLTRAQRSPIYRLLAQLHVLR